MGIIPPFVREFFGFSDAAVRCCTSSRPTDEAPVRMAHGVGQCGVGLILQDAANSSYNGYNVSVASLSMGGPGEASHQIQAGDALVKIDGRDVVGKRTGELADWLLGPVGSAVSLQMKRGPAWKGGEGKVYTVDLNRRWAAAGLKDLPSAK